MDVGEVAPEIIENAIDEFVPDEFQGLHLLSFEDLEDLQHCLLAEFGSSEINDIGYVHCEGLEHFTVFVWEDEPGLLFRGLEAGKTGAPVKIAF